MATVMVACLALPALAGATSYSVKWAKSALLANPNAGYALTSVTCAPTDTSTAAAPTPSSSSTSTTGTSTSTTGTSTGTSTSATATAAAGNTTTDTTTTATTTPTATGSTIVNSTLLCLAGDNRGGIWASVHPALKSSWHRERVDTAAGGVAITAIACPALNLCVAVDAHGQVMHSADPSVAAKDWTHPKRVDTATEPGGGYAGFSAISCPSTQLCVAVDNDVNGQVAYTTDPAGPASDWQIATIAAGVVFDSVSCPTTSLCVIGGSERYYSVDPTGGASAWTGIGSLDGASSMIASLSCNTAKLCVGVGYGNAGTGLASSSSTLATSGGTWTGAYVGADPPAPGTGLVDSVACPERNFCVAVDGASNAYTSTSPVRGDWKGPKPLKPKSSSTYSAVSCNETLCVEVDNRGTATYGVVKAASATSTTKSTTTTTTTTSTTSTTK